MSSKVNPDNTYVHPEGQRDAGVMLIGQNPGKEEANTGRPFVGRAGKYFDAVLTKNGIDRKKLYITSVVKQGTPHNRKPTEEEIRYWMPHLIEEIKSIKPRTIILRGTVAWKTSRFEGIRYIETYHPAAATRFPV